jgi:hypothetical protein
MGANQNYLGKLGICPKLDPRASLLTQSSPHSYRQAIDPRNRVREQKLQRKARIDDSKATREPTATNTAQKPFSLSQEHSIEHFLCITKKTP